jgi:hypothetical protein
MRILVDQGFILSAKSHFGEFGYVLLVNPYFVAQGLFNDGKIQRDVYLALERRALEIGAVFPK